MQQTSAPKPPEEGIQPPWLMSFADFVSCLLACFVLLFSMVSIDRAKFDKIIGSIPGREHLDLQAPQPIERGMTPESADAARSPDYLLSLLRGSFAKDPKLAKLGLKGDGDRVVVTLPTDSLIAELTAGNAARPDGLLFAVAGALRSFPNEIRVEGRGVGAADQKRWGNLLMLTQLTAGALEQGGLEGPIAARTELSTAGASAMQVTIIVTERAAKP